MFHTHAGIVAHDDLIGALEGSTVLGSTGRRFVVVRPTLADVVLKMPRGAQVIYPKDLAAIVMEADIGPGTCVLEAGVGSGALSMALLRAGAAVTGYELREDFADRARANVEAFCGPGVDYRVELRDVYDGIDERDLDRIVLDLPEPWRVLDHAAVALRPGGIVCAYLPTVNQTAQLREALDRARSVWPAPWRCSSAPGTSRTGRSVPTTAWSAIPGSSPPPACWSPRAPGTGERDAGPGP